MLSTRNPKLILAIATVISVSSYILASHFTLMVGFPLDDSWIHQTYARNLVQYGEWAFWQGQSSGGSTAPLWSALLAIGYLFRVSHYSWAFMLGGGLLWGLSLLAEEFVIHLLPSYKGRFPWVGFFIIGEWHLVWAAASGMETLLYALLVTIVLVSLAIGKRNYLLLGGLIGLSVWVRPGGISLLAPVIVAALFSGEPTRRILKNISGSILSFGIIYSFYLLFNLFVTGTPLPNTYYAKQAEYAVLRELTPIWVRYLAEIQLPLIGAGVLLLPGALFYFWQMFQRRDIGVIVGVLWFLGYAGIYAWKLPVVYQHGRYMMPAMPIFFLWGMAGTISLLRKLEQNQFGKLFSFAYRASLIAVWVMFFGIGARSYASDVAIIETEMVATAKWVAENIPPDSIVAAHDIGALGYFDGRPLVDLAGLVSPEVIPFIRDEPRLAGFLVERGVDYLIVFPTWYKTLPEGLSLVYNTEGQFAPVFGGENMVVYQWSD